MEVEYLIDYISGIINIESINDSIYPKILSGNTDVIYKKEVVLPKSYYIVIYISSDGLSLTRFNISKNEYIYGDELRITFATFEKCDITSNGFTTSLNKKMLFESKMCNFKDGCFKDGWVYLDNDDSLECLKLILNYIFKREIRDKKLSKILND